ncbi:MAG: hypothetical protein ACK415_05770 [Thermodesulfovibrionales bacterium]
MIYTELRKAVTHHLIAGAIISATIFFAGVLSRYESSLLDAIGKFELIQINTAKLNQSTAEIDSVKKKITAMLPPNYASKTHRELILLTLDDIKMTLKGSEITVTDFDNKAGDLSLQVNIKIPVDNYAALVNRIGYLQSLRFPHFAIKNMTIEKASDKEGVIISKIEGLLKMPLEELRTAKR